MLDNRLNNQEKNWLTIISINIKIKLLIIQLVYQNKKINLLNNKIILLILKRFTLIFSSENKFNNKRLKMKSNFVILLIYKLN